jgi:hypothetical protein
VVTLLASACASPEPSEQNLKMGIGQQCYALWDANTKAWTWE